MATDTCILGMPAVVYVEASVVAVGEVDLKPSTLDVVKDDGTCPLAKVGAAKGKGLGSIITKLSTDHLE